jgi:hypothetical protein
VLEHLQDNRSDWLVARGLDRNLKIRANGTFLLTFPGFGRIWTSYDSHKRQHWLSVYRKKMAVRFLLKDHERAAIVLQEQHQLQRQTSSSSSTTSRVQDYHLSSILKVQRAVDEMIKAVETMEAKERHPSSSSL